MRYIFVFSGMLFLLTSCSFFQKSDEIDQLTKKVDSLTTKVAELSEQNKALDEEFTWMENELVRLTSAKQSAVATTATESATKVAVKETKDWQCKAITNSGNRCSRPALEDSKYCWQHKKTYEPDKPDKPETKTPPTGNVPGNPVQK